jgi:hypothetical protein
MKQYADLFETMVGAYWVQPGVTYEEVFNWIDVTFRPLFYVAEQDVRNGVKAKIHEKARLKAENREAALTSSIIHRVNLVVGPTARFKPIQPIRPGPGPGPVTRSNAARRSAPHPPHPQPQPLKEDAEAVKPPPSSPPTKRVRFERTGPVLNVSWVWNTSFWLDIADWLHSQEVVDLTMLD